MKRVIIPLILALALLVAGPRLASAHAELVSSSPADGSVVAWTNAPKTATLTFSEEVAKDVTTVSVTSADGTSATTGAATVDFDNPKMVTVGLTALTPGPYTIKWHAVTADDNGQTDGTITFTILNNTGGTTNAGGTTGGGTTTTGGGTSGGTTTTGGTTTGGTTTSGGTLPTTGAPSALPLLGLLFAGLILGLGVVLRRRAPTR